MSDFQKREDLLREAIEHLLQEAVSTEDAIEQLTETIQQRYEKINSELGAFNVLVIGKSGVGKSTLLNAIFRENLASTGSGRSITQNTTQYSNENCPLTIYDSKGIELPNEANSETIAKLENDIHQLIETNKSDPKRQIDIIWYCINTLGHRIEELEEEWIGKLASKKIPVIIVLTQFFGSEADKKFLNYIKSRDIAIETTIGVMAKDYDLGNGYPSFPAQGLEELVERTAYCLGTGDRVRQLFVQQQLASISLKEKEALNCLTRYTALTIPAAAIPISGVDSIALWGILSTMIGEISSIFGLSPNSDFINTVVEVLTGAGSSAVATLVLPSLLKMFPVVGTLSATGTALVVFPTVAGIIGTAYIKGLKAYLSRRIDQQPTSDEEARLRRRFTRFFKRAYKDYLESRPDSGFEV